MNNIYQTSAPAIAVSLQTQQFKRPLKLPRTPEELVEADNLLSAVVLSVLQATTAEGKNSCLCTGVYVVLASRFGTRPLSRSHKQVQSRLKHHDRALKKVTKLKNEARQALRRAKREGESAPITQSLATQERVRP